MGLSKLDNAIVRVEIELPEENPSLSGCINTQEKRHAKGSKGTVTD